MSSMRAFISGKIVRRRLWHPKENTLKGTSSPLIKINYFASYNKRLYTFRIHLILSKWCTIKIIIYVNQILYHIYNWTIYYICNFKKWILFLETFYQYNSAPINDLYTKFRQYHIHLWTAYNVCTTNWTINKHVRTYWY